MYVSPFDVDFIQAEDFPTHIKQHLQMMKDREEFERRQRELDKSMCKVNCYAQSLASDV